MHFLLYHRCSIRFRWSSSQLIEVAINHVAIVQKNGYYTVLNLSINTVFLLEDQDHDQVYSKHAIFKFLANRFAHSAKVENEATLLNQKQHVDKLVPVLQRNETVSFETLLFAKKVGQNHEHYGVTQGLIKGSYTKS